MRMGTFHLQKFEKMQKIKDQMIVIIVLKQQNKTIIINLESIRKNSRWRWHLNKIVLIKRTKEVDWFVNCALLNGWLIFIILLFISEVCYTYFYALCLFHFILCCDVAHLVPFCRKKIQNHATKIAIVLSHFLPLSRKFVYCSFWFFIDLDF